MYGNFICSSQNIVYSQQFCFQSRFFCFVSSTGKSHFNCSNSTVSRPIESIKCVSYRLLSSGIYKSVYLTYCYQKICISFVLEGHVIRLYIFWLNKTKQKRKQFQKEINKETKHLKDKSIASKNNTWLILKGMKQRPLIYVICQK